MNYELKNLHSRTPAELVEAFASIPHNVTSLNLCGNNLENITGEELAVALTAVPQNVTTLNLSNNQLDEISHAGLMGLKDSLLQLQTVYLSYDEVKAMSVEEREALRAAFPKIHTVILVDDNNKKVSGLPLLENLAWQLGDKNKAPSLFSQCAFFINRNLKFDLKKDNLEKKDLDSLDNLTEAAKEAIISFG